MVFSTEKSLLNIDPPPPFIRIFSSLIDVPRGAARRVQAARNHSREGSPRIGTNLKKTF